MEDKVLISFWIKIIDFVLQYVANNSLDTTITNITDFQNKKKQTKFDEALRDYLKKNTSDQMYDTLDNFVSKEITFIYQDSIDSQAKDCLTHLVEKFYSDHPEWRFENKKITSLLEYAIRKTNASIISQLNVDDRILFLQSQKNTQMVIEVLDKMTQQLVNILQSTSLFPEKTKHKFQTDCYIDYLDSIWHEHCRLSFSVYISSNVSDLNNYYELEPNLFKKLMQFMEYNWKDTLKRGLKEQTQEDIFFAKCVKEIDSNKSLYDNANILKIKLENAKKNDEYSSTRLNYLLKKLEQTVFGNCIFITGYYGSGKTRLFLELSKHIKEKELLEINAIKTLFLFVNFNEQCNIENNIIAIFRKLFPGDYSIEQYLNIFSRQFKLVIVLDDIHMYFQNNCALESILKKIKAYSRTFVKWIVITQLGYGEITNDLYQEFYNNYSFKWGEAFERYQIGKWFNLDDWNKDCDIPGKLLGKIYPTAKPTSIWKKNLYFTDYYTPLFSKVLLCYIIRTGNISILNNNLLFLDFCRKYYYILSENKSEINYQVREVALHLLKKHSLLFSLEPNCFSGDKSCENLINSGLLFKKEDYFYKTILVAIPDIVWIYQLAKETEWLNNTFSFPITVISEAWDDNPDLYNSLLNMSLQMMEEASRKAGAWNAIIKNWDFLLDNGFERAVLDSGFKYSPYLRKKLIKRVLNRSYTINTYFAIFLSLCSLGGIPFRLLCKIIDIIIKNHSKKIRIYGNCFSNMLWRNYQTLTWSEILAILPHLYPMQRLEIDMRIIRKIGEDIGKSVVEKVDNLEQLELVIKASMAANQDNNLEIFDKQIPKNKAYLSNILDWFCASFCNTVIQRFHTFGFDKLYAAGWYSFTNRLKQHEKRRNRALTLSLSYYYRQSVNQQSYDVGYIMWYHNLLTGLSKGDYGHKRFALYLIVHTGLKEQNYLIESPQKKLIQIARTLILQNSIKKLITEPSIKKFIESNKDILLGAPSDKL